MSIITRHQAAASRVIPESKLIIGGRDVVETSSGSITHINPSTGRPQREVLLGGVREVDDAVLAARAASKAWRQESGARRRDLLHALSLLIEREADTLATLAVLEMGATRSSMLHGQLPMVKSWFAYYGGWADKIDGLYASDASSGAFDFVLPEPYGVVAIILPWNGPLGSLAMKAVPALAAGNTLVIKPPELAPFLAIRFAELARDAGFPDGVINVIVGGPDVGDALVRHAGVDKISFTGSPATARHILAAAAAPITPTLLELGGKSANIIFSDADFEKAASYSASMPFSNAGQICVCPSRVLVDDAIFDSFVARVAELAEAIEIGDPLEDATVMGPMFSKAGRDRVLEYAHRAALLPGAEIVAGGTVGSGEFADGWFIRPTIIVDPDPSSELSQTELFGPIVTIHRFKSEDEAIRIANGTEFGLAAYVHTENMGRALRVARSIEAGGIYINRSYPVQNPNLPFGGIGSSGYGREGGRAGLDEFIKLKSISVEMA